MLPLFRVRALALVAACAALLPFAPQPVQAQSLGVQGLWSNLLTTSSSGRGYEPEVAYDRQGFLHMVFFAGPTQDEWAIFYTNNRGGSFSTPRLISEASGEQRSPDMAIGSDGHVHVIYEKRGIDHIYYVESPDLGTTWLKPFDLTKYDTKAYEPAIAVDANNAVHAVFTDRHWAGDQQVTYATRAAGGAWSGTLKVGGNTFDRYPDVTTSGTGAAARVFIAYQGRERTSLQNDAFEIYLVSTLGGRFQPPSNVSNDPGVWSLEPTIISDGGSELYLAWDKQVNKSHDIVFARSTNLGASWTAPRDLARRPATAASPTLAFGRSGGVPRVHIAWDEDGAAIYALYEPASNSFGDSLEQISPQRNAKELSLAASDTVNQVAAAYQGANLAVLAAKIPGIPLGATLTVNDGQAVTTSRTLSVALSNLRGNPSQMRYAFGRSPNDGDAWQPLATAFRATAPPGGCAQSFNLQLQASDGRRSGVLTRAIQIDDAVQASVDMRNPFLGDSLQATTQSPPAIQVAAGSPDYTRDGLFYLGIADAGECSSLASFSLNGGSAYPLNGSFSDVLPLPGPTSEGPHPLTLALRDALGNQLTINRTLTLDRTPPTLLGGTLSIAAPAAGLPSPLATLLVSQAVISDNLYPGAAWGLLVANTLDPAADDPALHWRAIAQAPVGGGFQLKGWNVLAGLAPADGSLAGRPIQVRLKLLDGAGNPSTNTLTTTVTLAQDYRLPATYLAYIVR